MEPIYWLLAVPPLGFIVLLLLNRLDDYQQSLPRWPDHSHDLTFEIHALDSGKALVVSTPPDDKGLPNYVKDGLGKPFVFSSPEKAAKTIKKIKANQERSLKKLNPGKVTQIVKY